MKRNKNKALFFAWLSMGLMIMSIWGMFTSKSNNEIVGAVMAFVLCGFLGIVAILDYEYSKKQENL
jgi:prepilin signal peptidase PulO-like enzyme (type II secretory pathway)